MSWCTGAFFPKSNAFVGRARSITPKSMYILRSSFEDLSFAGRLVTRRVEVPVASVTFHIPRTEFSAESISQPISGWCLTPIPAASNHLFQWLWLWFTENFLAFPWATFHSEPWFPQHCSLVALQDAHLPQKDDGHQKNHHGNHQRNQPVLETGNNRGNLAKRKRTVRKTVEQRQGEAQICLLVSKANCHSIIYIWLVVLTILKNMSSSMGRIIPYMMENKIHLWNHQPHKYIILNIII